MVDALLQEHARLGSGDDEQFLQSVEARLDEDDKVVGITTGGSPVASPAGNRLDSRLGNRFGMGLGIAAGLTVAAVGFYGWHQQRETERTSVATYEVENPVKRSEGGGAASERAAKSSGSNEQATADSLPAPKDVAQLREMKKETNREAAVKGDKRLSAKPAETDSAVDSRLDGRAPVAAVEDSRPSAPAASMGRAVAANSSPHVEIPARGVNVPAPTAYYSDTDAFGYGSEVEDQGEIKSPRERVKQHVGNRYGELVDNSFKSPWQDPLSTFSVDVDTASYANVRRMIQQGQSVPADAVRIEEMINYFDYAYPQPEGKHPFSVNVETASCPWNAGHRLVKIGLQGKDVAREQRPAANLVFLLDVSGSMNNQDKLPLLVDSMKILLKELNGDDSVSIVVYAGAEGVALPPTYVNEAGRKTILEKLNNFRSGGSTNGGAGIELAYKMAKKHFVKGGVNRVILGTDGDFNVGLVGTNSLVSMLEREAKSGVFLSVLGFGQGNLNDAMLEKITNKGNGNYFYIDNLREGRKVFLDDMMGTMVTIAKDVKIQVEFNPAKVKSYRLIGYANRMLKAEDFRDKRVDAGEIGAGHTMTALYEIVPGNGSAQSPEVDDLKYQQGKKQPQPEHRELVASPEMLTVKLAYKEPEATKETESTYFETVTLGNDMNWQQASADFKFASGVALFGMLQRQSEHVGQGTYSLVGQLAEQGRGDDAKGLRTEFSDLVRKVK